MDDSIGNAVLTGLAFPRGLRRVIAFVYIEHSRGTYLALKGMLKFRKCTTKPTSFLILLRVSQSAWVVSGRLGEVLAEG